MSFANQALCVRYIVEKSDMKPKVYSVPKKIDELVARLKLKAVGAKIDELTEEQKAYIATWQAGTI